MKLAELRCLALPFAQCSRALGRDLTTTSGGDCGGMVHL